MSTTTVTPSLPHSRTAQDPARSVSQLVRRRWPLAVLTAAGVGATFLVSMLGEPYFLARLSPIAQLDPSARFRVTPEHVVGAAGLLLVVCWLALVWLTRRGEVGTRGVIAITTAWMVPLAIGAPVLSADAYSYLADGRLQMLGKDPWRVPHSVLGSGNPWLVNVDWHWIHSKAPYGPFGLLVERAAAATGSVAGGIAVLLAVTVIAIGATAWILASMVPANRRALVLALWLGCPIVSLHLLGGLHLDAVMAAFLAGALLATLRGRTVVAAVLVALAAAVKIPAVAAIPVVLLWGARFDRASTRRVALAAVAATVAYLLPTIVVGDITGLLGALHGPAGARTLSSPTQFVARLIPGSYQPVSRLMMVAGAALVVWLLLTRHRRSAQATLGGVLIAVVVFSPVVYPWYFAWALPAVLSVHSAWARRRVMVLVTAMSMVNLPGFNALNPPEAFALWVVLSSVLVLAWRVAGGEPVLVVARRVLPELHERVRRQLAGLASLQLLPASGAAVPMEWHPHQEREAGSGGGGSTWNLPIFTTLR